MPFLRAVLRSILPFLIGIPVLLVAQGVLDRLGWDAWSLILITAFINVVLAVSLNVVNGFTGQFSLGHAGFMAVGAYTAALITLRAQGSSSASLRSGSAATTSPSSPSGSG